MRSAIEFEMGCECRQGKLRPRADQAGNRTTAIYRLELIEGQPIIANKLKTYVFNFMGGRTRLLCHQHIYIWAFSDVDFLFIVHGIGHNKKSYEPWALDPRNSKLFLSLHRQ